MTVCSRLIVGLIWVLFLLVHQIVQGESTVEDGPAFRQQRVETSDFDHKIRLARQQIQRDDFLGASAILEILYAENPERPIVYSLLRNCYWELKYTDKLEMLARQIIARYPETYRFYLDLAEVLVRQQKFDEAMTTYLKMLSLSGTDSEYLVTISSMINAGFEDEALAVIDSLRGRLVNPSALALQRGIILEKQKLYRHAAVEFFLLLDDTTSDGPAAERRLLDLLEFEESSTEVEQALLEQTGTAANVRALKLLSGHYLKANRFDKAFEFAVRQDSLEGLKGKSLAVFMRTCRERRQYPEAARMGEYILNHYKSGPILADTYFMLADVLIRLDRFREAIAIYDTIAATFPRVQDKAEALFMIGTIHLDCMNDPQAALVYYDSVLSHYPFGIGRLKALRARPFCYLRMGSLAEAATYFEDLLNRQMNEDILEETGYYLALIEFCEKKIDSSEIAFRRLLVDYPRGFYINDALRLILVMEAAKEAPRLLYDYSNALLFELRRMPDSCMAKLRNIADNENKALADIALLRLSEMSLGRGDSAAALQYIDQLAVEFPDSYYAPYGLKTKADLYFLNPGQREEAKAIYRRLLEDYPNYPFSSEVREKMRELEIDLSTS